MIHNPQTSKWPNFEHPLSGLLILLSIVWCVLFCLQLHQLSHCLFQVPVYTSRWEAHSTTPPTRATTRCTRSTPRPTALFTLLRHRTQHLHETQASPTTSLADTLAVCTHLRRLPIIAHTHPLVVNPESHTTQTIVSPIHTIQTKSCYQWTFSRPTPFISSAITLCVLHWKYVAISPSRNFGPVSRERHGFRSQINRRKFQWKWNKIAQQCFKNEVLCPGMSCCILGYHVLS